MIRSASSANKHWRDGPTPGTLLYVFVPGVELAGRLYREAVRPSLAEHFPELVYSAALVGSGSEVLGFDTVRSTDHNWGPRLLLFLPAEDRLLAERLPAGVEVVSLRTWLTGHLGFSPLGAITTLDWLATPTQVLAEVATIGDPDLRGQPLTGAVDQFVDSTDALADRIRTRRLVG